MKPTTLILALILSGCPTAPLPTMDPDGGADGGERQDAGLTEVDAGAWQLVWSTGPEFPRAIDHHTTFIGRALDGGSRVYVLGGHDSTDAIFDTIYAATILANGGLDAWEEVGKLRRSRAFHSVTRAGGIFFAGGLTADGTGKLSAEGEVSTLGTYNDGGLGTFTHSYFPQVALHPTFESAQGWLVMVGGTNGQTPGTGVWTVPEAGPGYEITDAGPRTTAVAAAPLPEPRSHHVSVVHDNHIYVAAGLTTNDGPVKTILRSRHDDAGMVNGWDVAGSMEDPPWTASAFEFDGHLYIVGGGSFMTEPAWQARVRRAPFLADGGVGAFEDVVSPLPHARAHVHQTPAFNGFIYSVGGRVEGTQQGTFDSTNRVDIGRLVHLP